MRTRVPRKIISGATLSITSGSLALCAVISRNASIARIEFEDEFKKLVEAG
ncbi:hypothetical protein [Lactovum odontotermitis]